MTAQRDEGLAVGTIPRLEPVFDGTLVSASQTDHGFDSSVRGPELPTKCGTYRYRERS